MKYSVKTKKYLLAFVSALSLGLSIENGWSGAFFSKPKKETNGNAGGNVNPAPQQQGQEGFEPSVELVDNAEGKYIIINLNDRSYRLQFKNENKCWRYTSDARNWNNIESTESLYNFFIKEINDNSLVLQIISEMLKIQKENGIDCIDTTVNHMISHGHMGYSIVKSYEGIINRIPRENSTVPRGVFVISDKEYTKKLNDYIKQSISIIKNIAARKTPGGILSIKESYNKVIDMQTKYAKKIYTDIFQDLKYNLKKIDYSKRHKSINIVISPKEHNKKECIDGWAFDEKAKQFHEQKTKNIMIYIEIEEGSKGVNVISIFPYDVSA